MPRTPVDSRPLKTRTSVSAKRMHLPALCREQHIVLIGADLHADDAVAGLQLHRDLAVAVDAGEIGELVAPHIAGFGGEHDVELFPLRSRPRAAAGSS